MLLFYGITILLSASLLFLIQPMFSKMVLPLLGGSPGVWNTCMVFFQAMLLAGYAYAHATTTWLGVRRQAALHLVVLFLPLVVLPIAIPRGWTPPADSNPIVWLLMMLTVSVGLPFFVVSASNPMLQKWFAATGHPAAKDPYFLYGASNLGSMFALLSYPVLVEPNLRLAAQGWLWAIGYGTLAFLTAGCAILLWRTSSAAATTSGPGLDVGEHANEPPAPAEVTGRRRLRWVVLTFVPSSLMLGVTTYLTTDIASAPLIWIIPLALYLSTFILVFASRPPIKHSWMVKVLPWMMLPLAISMVTTPKEAGLWVPILLNLLTFFVAAMVCHGELADNRPSTRNLTEYYFWMSVGGVLGGMFNALLAPLIFTSPAEYPLALVFACLLLPTRGGQEESRRGRWLDLALPAALAVLLVGFIRFFVSEESEMSNVSKLVLFGVPAMICFTFSERPIRFGLGIGVIMLSGTFHTIFHTRVLYTERSFFGVHRVTISSDGRFEQLFHGTTNHGMQFRDEARQHEPLSYYHRTGPIGQLFDEFDDPYEKPNIAILGLGCGGMTAYWKPGQHFTFFEIDPAVQRIAENPEYFTYLELLGKKNYDIILGDGRLTLADSEKIFDMIFLDAFSSDAIPIHLVTREAIELYLSKLADNGILIFNISNRFIHLEPILGDLASDAGLVCLSCPDYRITEKDSEEGKAASHFVVIARKHEDFEGLMRNPNWQELAGRPGVWPWTDDFSNILGALKW